MSPAPVVLVIEDDPDIREAIADVLVMAGHDVALAAHGAEGLAWLEAHPRPGLILLDLMMPVMTGYEFLEHVRADRRWDGIPIALFSADGRLDSRAVELGVASFLRKPIDLDDLLAAVDAHLGPQAG
jgi:CheY-like chemotaxis protein